MQENFVCRYLVTGKVLDDLKNICNSLKTRCEEQKGFNFNAVDFETVVNKVSSMRLHPNSMYCFVNMSLPGMDYGYMCDDEAKMFKWQTLEKSGLDGYLIYQDEIETICDYLKKFISTKDNVINGVGIRLGRDLADIMQRTLQDGSYYFITDEDKDNSYEYKKSVPIDNIEESDEHNPSDIVRDETNKEFMDAFLTCRNIFVDKLKDYGPSWRIFRSQSVTDQLFIKGTRIRSLQETGVTAVGEGTYNEFCALVNYGIIALIQLECGYSNTYDMTHEQALEMYDKYMKIAFDLMVKKNHDYDEAWRSMRIFSYTDFVLVKLARIKQIEDNGFDSGKSEGVDSNYLDIINYSIFGLIKLNEDKKNG